MDKGDVGHLVDAIQQLSIARDLPTIQTIVRSASRQLAGSDGATFVLRDGEQCFYADEDAIEPLWKGQRFPLEACISGWSMVHRSPAIIPDIYSDDRIPHEAYRPTFVQSLVMVPIRTLDPIGAIGNHWASHHAATSDEVGLLQALANSTAVALENVALYQELETRIADRTAQLTAANERLEALSLTDELTGLFNRRGFTLLVEQELKVLARSKEPGLLMFVDVDGLKGLNDSCGHDAGDDLIRMVAATLQASFRDADIVGRVGGDEFTIFLPGRDDAADSVRRLRAALDTAGPDRAGRPLSVSVGAAQADPAVRLPLDDLLKIADAAMYDEKHRRRTQSEDAVVPHPVAEAAQVSR